MFGLLAHPYTTYSASTDQGWKAFEYCHATGELRLEGSVQVWVEDLSDARLYVRHMYANRPPLDTYA